MKIFNAKVQKEGIGKNGKAYTKIGFQDETGKWYSSFDTLLLNVTEGQWVDGSVEPCTCAVTSR